LIFSIFFQGSRQIYLVAEVLEYLTMMGLRLGKNQVVMAKAPFTGVNIHSDAYI
jgi:hypothetical protein